MTSAKDFSEITRNWLEILKAVLVIIVFGWIAWEFAFNRPFLRDAAKDIGIERLSGPGFEVSLAKTTDELPKAKAALDAANQRINGLSEQYSAAVSALDSAKGALSGASGSAPFDASHARSQVDQVLSHAPATFKALGQAKSQIAYASDSTAAAIRSLPGANDTSLGFGIVFGADPTQKAAEDQLALGARLGSGEPHLFHRQGTYRSVLVFPGKAAASASLSGVRALNGYSRTAYVVNLASWCPNANLSSSQPVECSFQAGR